MGRKSFSTEMSLPTQSPALRAVFRSMGNWTLLSYFVSEGFFFFLLSPLCNPKFSGEVSGWSWDVWGVLFGFRMGKIKSIFYIRKKGLFCTNTITAACCCFWESLLTFFNQNIFHSPSNWCLLLFSPPPPPPLQFGRCCFFKQFMHFHFYVFLKGQQTPKHASLPFCRWAVSINIKNFSLFCLYFIYSHPFSHCFPPSWTCRNCSKQAKGKSQFSSGELEAPHWARLGQ